MLHWRDLGLYRRRVCALIRSPSLALLTSNSSKLAFESRSFLWFEMPSYSIHLLEPTSRSGKRLTWAFQFPIRKSKSCAPSCCAACWAATGACSAGPASACRIGSSKATRNVPACRTKWRGRVICELLNGKVCIVGSASQAGRAIYRARGRPPPEQEPLRAPELYGRLQLARQLLDEDGSFRAAPLAPRAQRLQQPAQVRPQGKHQHGVGIPLQGGNEIVQLVRTFLECPQF